MLPLEPSGITGSCAFVDLETTGLDPESDAIIEIAVVVVNTSTKEHSGLVTLVNPGRPLSKFIVDLTGINDEMLSKAPTQEILTVYFDLIGDRTICAYNAKFDMAFLSAAARRLGRRFENKSYCIMEMVRGRHPGLRSYKLNDVCAAFGISAEGNYHRATADVKCTFKLALAVHAGQEPLESALKQRGRRVDYCLWGYYTESDLLFYVLNGKDDAPDPPKEDAAWSYFVQTHLHGKYRIQCLARHGSIGEVNEKKAVILATHADSLLNRGNPYRKVLYDTLTEYANLNSTRWACWQQGQCVEKTDPDTALAHYQTVLNYIHELSGLRTEVGLFGSITMEMNSLGFGHDAIRVVDRMTLIL